jgi:hypothetical protein
MLCSADTFAGKGLGRCPNKRSNGRCSGDFRVAEAVDSVQIIYGTIPKKFFKQNPAYWSTR